MDAFDSYENPWLDIHRQEIAALRKLVAELRAELEAKTTPRPLRLEDLLLGRVEE